MYVSLFPVSFCLYSFPVSTYGFYIASSFLFLMLSTRLLRAMSTLRQVPSCSCPRSVTPSTPKWAYLVKISAPNAKKNYRPGPLPHPARTPTRPLSSLSLSCLPCQTSDQPDPQYTGGVGYKVGSDDLDLRVSSGEDAGGGAIFLALRGRGRGGEVVNRWSSEAARAKGIGLFGDWVLCCSWYWWCW